jgi:hypothetical protein
MRSGGSYVSDALWHRRRAYRRAITALTLMGVVSVSGCSSGSEGVPTRFAASSLPATAPYLLMPDSSTGWAIWPSGDSWLLLRTGDGWRTVTNVTPAAVPTDGGLVVARSSVRVVAAVGAYERLVRSPILTRDDAATQWQTGELPGAVIDDRNAVSLVAGHASAVLAPSGGTVVIASRGRWSTLTTAAALVPDGSLHLDTVTWADAHLGWLTGHGPAGTPVVFQTTDAGRSWTSVPVPSSAVAALAPCGAGRHWLFPVIGGGGITVHRTMDGGRHWYAGASLSSAAGIPAWGCKDNHVWMAGKSGSADHVFSSDDGGQSWADRGLAPVGLSALAPEGGGSGFAASHTEKSDTLWAVTQDGGRFTVRPLPAWLATLGAQQTTS